MKRKEKREQERAGLEKRRRRWRGKSHLDLAFICGADPVWGEFSAGLAVEQREALCSSLQCSLDKIRFQSIGGLREWLERHVSLISFDALGL